MHRALFTSSNHEYYTPAWVLETIRRHILPLWGIHTFDLDPASCQYAQQTVQATTWCGPDHPDPAYRDGLAVPWHGYVWLNPPYGSAMLRWMTKLVEEYTRGVCNGALVLVPARLETRWFRLISKYMVGFYVFHKRLAFVTPTASAPTTTTAPFPSALVVIHHAMVLPPLPTADRYMKLP